MPTTKHATLKDNQISRRIAHYAHPVPEQLARRSPNSDGDRYHDHGVRSVHEMAEEGVELRYRMWALEVGACLCLAEQRLRSGYVDCVEIRNITTHPGWPLATQGGGAVFPNADLRKLVERHREVSEECAYEQSVERRLGHGLAIVKRAQQLAQLILRLAQRQHHVRNDVFLQILELGMRHRLDSVC